MQKTVEICLRWDFTPGAKMNAQDILTIVNVKGIPKTKEVKNSMAKTIAMLFVRAGLCKTDDITFTFPEEKK